jgi:hypothetical protein
MCNELEKSIWLPQITDGRTVSAVLRRATQLQVEIHHSVPEEHRHFQRDVLTAVYDWHESNDRIDAVGLVTKAWLLRKVEIRIDHLLSRMSRSGVWLVVLEAVQTAENGLNATFWLVADPLWRVAVDGVEEAYVVYVPPQSISLEQSRDQETWDTEGA